jgi:hypothetical protein
MVTLILLMGCTTAWSAELKEMVNVSEPSTIASSELMNVNDCCTSPWLNWSSDMERLKSTKLIADIIISP